MAAISKKRKLESEPAPPKFYAVRAGHQPGVYVKWADCQRNITGFKGAQFKSFPSEYEAKEFVAGKRTASTKSTGDKFYGVAVGKVPGVYEDWAAASEQISGIKGPKYKKFATRSEAEAFVASGGKIAKAGTEDLPPKSKKARMRTDSSEGSIVIHTDGSSRGNGKVGAAAGVGVYFGENDDRNVSERLEGDLQTNQRAELSAIQRALETVPQNRDVLIRTDSNYSINCLTLWHMSWKKNGWKTSLGSEVLNKDLVMAVRKLIDARNAVHAETEFEWVKGHSNDPGNEGADKLAVAGSYKSRS